MLYNLIILPIETIVEWVFNFFISKFTSFGIMGAVLGVSIIINFLALPLYNVADSLQEKERNIVKKLEPRIKKIKKTFKGNEQFMMLSTYYRQNNYNPLYVLRSSLSILIEIPFFIAAYHYLSHCDALKGASFWIFNDLGNPDSLISFGGFQVHILPVIMTLINFVSGAIYTKDAPFREKIQLYLIAALFLVLLYKSPSGLVIYWIFNNIFSLIKNIVMKQKNPGKILHISVSILLTLASIYFILDKSAIWKSAIFCLFTVLIILAPSLNGLLRKHFKIDNNLELSKLDLYILILSTLGLSILCGFLLPSSVISTSPIEFSYLGSTESPLTYVWTTFTFFIGLFFIWPLIIYKMFGNTTKKIESIFFCIIFFIVISNIFIFKSNYSNLNALFELDNHLSLVSSISVSLLSIIIYLVLIFVIVFLLKSKFNKYIPYFLIAICIGEIGMGILKYSSIKNNYKIISSSGINFKNQPEIQKEYHLSKDKNNVVVLFLDKAVTYFVPYIFDENIEIKKQFDGFTYYPNTISFSDFTITGSPAMYGGYEYNQENMNLRKDLLLRDKHNEALLVMPKLFSNAGYSATFTDPSWPNYHARGDLDFAKKYPDIKVSEIAGKYYSNYKFEKGMENLPLDLLCKKGCVDFSILQSLPPFIRITFYDAIRRIPGHKFNGDNFFSQLSNLYYLSDMTDFDSDKNTFTFIENETTHEDYITLNDDFETFSENQLENKYVNTYHANTAALKQIGKFLDYLRENNVYDNTRIIIVSDHGENRGQLIDEIDTKITKYGALLLFKDFNQNEVVSTNNEFMTNADTLFLATLNLNIDMINPFTNNYLEQHKENGVNIYHCQDLNPEHFRNAYEFKLDKNEAWHVSDNIFDINNWKPLTEKESN